MTSPKNILTPLLTLSLLLAGILAYGQAGDYLVTENQQNQNEISGATITYIPRSWKNPFGGYYVYTLYEFCWEQVSVRPELWDLRRVKVGSGYLKKQPGGFLMVGDNPGTLIPNGSGFSFLSPLATTGNEAGALGGTWDPFDFDDLLDAEYDDITDEFPDCD